jgi:hypothetical protein
MKVRITEIPIQNIVRPAGKSNYGIWRTFTVFFDLMRLKFLLSFYLRPLQMFGTAGLALIGAGLVVMAGIVFQRIVNDVTLVDMGSSIFLLAIALVLGGVNFIFFGLLAELMVKLFHEGHKIRPYVVEAAFGEYPTPIYPWKFAEFRDRTHMETYGKADTSGKSSSFQDDNSLMRSGNISINGSWANAPETTIT